MVLVDFETTEVGQILLGSHVSKKRDTNNMLNLKRDPLS